MSTARPAPGSPDRPRRTVAWRDPRLAVGVLLVAGSVVLGAVVLGDDDPGTPVWQVSTDLAAGSVLDPQALTTVRVDLPDAGGAAYVSAATPLPGDTVLRRGVAAGELLPRAALEAAGPALSQVPVPTTESAVPGTVRPGSVVDVWVAPEDTTGALDARATQVLDDVTVVSLPSGVSLGGGAPQPLVVGVPEGSTSDLGRVIAQLAQGTAVVVGQG